MMRFDRNDDHGRFGVMPMQPQVETGSSTVQQ
jgi:hypothetical protein